MHQDLEARIRVLEEAKSQLESDLDARSSELHTVSQELQETKEQAQEKEQELTEANDTLKMQLEQVRTEKDNIEARLGGCIFSQAFSFTEIFLMCYYTMHPN